MDFSCGNQGSGSCFKGTDLVELVDTVSSSSKERKDVLDSGLDLSVGEGDLPGSDKVSGSNGEVDLESEGTESDSFIEVVCSDKEPEGDGGLVRLGTSIAAKETDSDIIS